MGWLAPHRCYKLLWPALTHGKKCAGEREGVGVLPSGAPAARSVTQVSRHAVRRGASSAAQVRLLRDTEEEEGEEERGRREGGAVRG